MAAPSALGPRIACFIALVAINALPRVSDADVDRDRASAAGYLRIMTRPSLSGGDSKLGFWNLYGRLLNEGPFASLQLRLSVLQQRPATDEPWAAIFAKVEGGSVANADRAGGRLSEHILAQLYVQAGNVLLKDVTWQLGTLESYFGDLGLYDMRPAQIMGDTIGLYARYRAGRIDALVGVGDAGFRIRREDYSTILSSGAALRLRLSNHFELGLGAQFYVEPKVDGNRFAPHSTPDLVYEDFVRGEVAEQFLAENPGMEDFFPRPIPRSASAGKVVGYLGFGKLGPLAWTNVFANINREPPQTSVTETFGGRDYDVFIADLTDERFSATVGMESQFRIIPKRLDVIWGALYGHHWNRDNNIAIGDDDRSYASTVVRAQAYVTPQLHILAETALAWETSTNGTQFRNGVDSVFRSTDGIQDARGLEFGDADVRNTWQGKVGWVLNPMGTGIYTRPSLRLIYGAQYSSQTDAFGNSFVQSLDENEVFPSKERHLHQVIALEAEAWF